MVPSILVTRKLPASVLARLEEAGEVDLYVGEQAIAPDELRRRVAGKDALVCMLTERVDKFEIGGKWVAIPVMGAFELEDGKIRAWRDYFDLAQFTKQLPGAPS